MQLDTTNEIWEKIILSYEWNAKVKSAKIKSLIIQYENFRMHNDEIIANLFLRLDEIVNHMRNMGEEIRETTLVEKIYRSLSPKLESKLYAIEEKQDLQNITVVQLHGILTAREMRKGGPSEVKEVVFRVVVKGKEMEE